MLSPDKREYVLLSLGANLGDREQSLRDAIAYLQDNGVLSGVSTSSLYETEPYGVLDQPAFINMVVSGFTSLSVFSLLQICKSIEYLMGRCTRERWHEREIDIDILIYGDLVISKDKIKIPHPSMGKRKFVLIPAAEIAAKAKDPKSCKTIAELLDECEDDSDVYRLN